jgi:hypothetical protein
MTLENYLANTPVTGPALSYAALPSLISNALQSPSYPSISPFPPPRNVITGKSAGVLNDFRLELSACKYGYDRALWICAADAAFFLLRPQNDPLLASFRTAKNSIHSNYVYLIDSFTPQSLSRLYSFANPAANARMQLQNNAMPPPVLNARTAMAEKIVYALAAYDSGGTVAAQRPLGAAAYLRNTSPSSPSFFVTKNTHAAYKAAIPPPYRKAFEYLRKYRLQQLTSLNVLGHNPLDTDARLSLEALSKAPSREVLPAVFYALTFASHLCRDDPPVYQPPPIAPATVQRRPPHTGTEVTKEPSASIDSFILGG